MGFKAQGREKLREILKQPGWVVAVLALASFAGGVLKKIVFINSAPEQIHELERELHRQQQSLAITQESIKDMQGRLGRIERKLDNIEPEVVVRKFVYRDQPGPPGALTRSQVKRKK